MIKGYATVQSSRGLHARPAAQIADYVKKSDSEVTFRIGDQEVDPSKYAKLLALSIKCGTEIEIIVDGSDEKRIFMELISILETVE